MPIISTLKTNKLFTTCCVLIFIIFGTTNCTSTTPQVAENQPSSQSHLTIGPIEHSYVTATSFEELVEQADIVVVGSAVEKGKVINTARNPLDPTQPDPNLESVGQIYTIRVNQYLKGAGGDSIRFVQSEGYLTAEMVVAGQTLEDAREQSDQIPLSLNKEYLLFLRGAPELDDGNLYVAVAQPSRFDISNPLAIVPESPWAYAKQYFPPQALADVLQLLETRIGQ
jgi:hypothetical protein